MYGPATSFLAGRRFHPAQPEVAVSMCPLGQELWSLWHPAGHRASSSLNDGQALEFLAGLLLDSPSRALAHRWSNPGPGWAWLPGQLSAKTRVTGRRRSVGLPAPVARG